MRFIVFALIGGILAVSVGFGSAHAQRSSSKNTTAEHRAKSRKTAASKKTTSKKRTATTKRTATKKRTIAAKNKVTGKGKSKARKATSRSGKRSSAKRSSAKRKSSKRKRRAKRRRPRRPSKAYRAMVRRWHKRAPRGVVRAWRKREPPPLVLRRVHKPVTVSLVPNEDGTFSEEQCKLAEEALASKKDGATHEVHPRLLELVYRAVKRFRVPYVHVVSGYRPSSRTSRHGQGRAIDLVFPGVGNGRLARFFREQGFVGVGIYPHSGFVHVDVRSRSYYWRDRSLPGASQRTRSILATQRGRNDARARRRGELAVPDLVDQRIPTSPAVPEPPVVAIDASIIEVPRDGG